jgi:hypothetical protein
LVTVALAAWMTPNMIPATPCPMMAQVVNVVNMASGMPCTSDG